MVSLEKNDHLMLARQLPLKSVALILAGGRGTRLKDLTNKRAKPAVHFGGKFRIIDFALSNCINSGIRRMGVITQYQSHTLVQHIQRGWSFFNEEMNEFVDLLPAQQRMKGENWYRGTADAVTQNLDIIRRYKAEYVVPSRFSSPFASLCLWLKQTQSRSVKPSCAVTRLIAALGRRPLRLKTSLEAAKRPANAPRGKS
jgi:hypothetical protein